MEMKKINITDYNIIMVLKSYSIGNNWLQIVCNEDDMFMVLLYNGSNVYLINETIYLSSSLEKYNNIINMIEIIMQ